ncbi:plasminogen-like [Gigantopelta aegis]|uniref:plasminogen-like n=1 Tax=Gigantopelta aegis TaxID=1735272 RepID=UPI001B888079|nr:plasminogen-like [Gigantopelta aegis]
MRCDPTKCYITVEKKALYAGTLSTGKSMWFNFTCQRFDSQYPYKHAGATILPYYFNVDRLSDVSNYCQDPNFRGKPWCYSNSLSRLASHLLTCNIPKCNPGPNCSIAPFVAGAKVRSMTKRQDGSVTAEYECVDGLVRVNSARAVCKGDNQGNEDWQVAAVICAHKTCYMLSSGPKRTSAVYAGTKNTTESGRKCQRWNSMFPHTHVYTKIADYLTDDSFDEVANYCRDPSGDLTPWCHTTDRSVRFEKCGIDACQFMG